MKENIKIKAENWSHTCGDGCCYTWGTDVFINGERVSSDNYGDIEYIIKDVLEHLGYNVELEE